MNPELPSRGHIFTVESQSGLKELTRLTVNRSLIERLTLFAATARAFPSTPRRPSTSPRSFACFCCRSTRYVLFRLAAGTRAGFALVGNGFFARAASRWFFRNRFGTFHHATEGPPCTWSNRALLLGGFSGNSAHHSADNRANRSCYTASRGSGDSTSGLFWNSRDFDVFG